MIQVQVPKLLLSSSKIHWRILTSSPSYLIRSKRLLRCDSTEWFDCGGYCCCRNKTGSAYQHRFSTIVGTNQIKNILNYDNHDNNNDKELLEQRLNHSDYEKEKEKKIPFYGEPRQQQSKATSTTSTQQDNSPILSLSQRIELIIRNASTAYYHPERADCVAAIGELTGHIALERMLRTMEQNPMGRLILKDRPIISKSTIPYERLIQEAQSKKITFKQIRNDPNMNITFGQAYGAFLASHQFDPDERDVIRYIEQNDLAYVMLRYRQCHDFYHTLTGLPPTVVGELGLKWFELFQTGLPLAAYSATIGSLRLSKEEQDTLRYIYLPWAQSLSKTVPFGTLLNIYYENEWDTPLQTLRKEMGIIPAPLA